MHGTIDFNTLYPIIINLSSNHNYTFNTSTNESKFPLFISVSQM